MLSYDDDEDEDEDENGTRYENSTSTGFIVLLKRMVWQKEQEK